MKKHLPAVFLAALLAVNGAHAQNITIDAETARASYGTTVTVSPSDSTVTITDSKIILAAKKEDVTYTISGYFRGQVINKTKNTVIKLKDVFLENTDGEPAVYGEAKMELSSAKGTVNYIRSSAGGTKTAAVQCRKNLVLGGSGTLYVTGGTAHGVKGDDVKIKGSGTFYLEGSKSGSALNCRSLTVENDKHFTAYFVNSKNGIKADTTITAGSGTFYLYDNGTALKTDTSKEAPGESHGIRLSGGSFHLRGNGAAYETDSGAFKSRVKFIED